jgi:hypothetical protein
MSGPHKHTHTHTHVCISCLCGLSEVVDAVSHINEYVLSNREQKPIQGCIYIYNQFIKKLKKGQSYMCMCPHLNQHVQNKKNNQDMKINQDICSQHTKRTVLVTLWWLQFKIRTSPNKPPMASTASPVSLSIDQEQQKKFSLALESTYTWTVVGAKHSWLQTTRIFWGERAFSLDPDRVPTCAKYKKFCWTFAEMVFLAWCCHSWTTREFKQTCRTWIPPSLCSSYMVARFDPVVAKRFLLFGS